MCLHVAHGLQSPIRAAASITICAPRMTCIVVCVQNGVAVVKATRNDRSGQCPSSV